MLLASACIAAAGVAELCPTAAATEVTQGAVAPSTTTAPARRLPRVDVPSAVRSAAPAAAAGAVVFDRQSRTPLLQLNAGRKFRSASLVKLLIAVDDLHRNGPAGPGRADRLRRMLSLSDDAEASRLWVDGGGSALVTRTARRLGLTGTEPPDIPGRWGNVLLTAHDVVRVYQHILDELPARDRALIVSALAAAPRRAADGWDQHFGIPEAVRGPFAVKQGWSDSAGDYVVHSTGVVGPDRRYIVVLLVSAPAATGWDDLRDATSAAARAVEPLL